MLMNGMINLNLRTVYDAGTAQNTIARKRVPNLLKSLSCRRMKTRFCLL